jgi:chemotaxis protein methyltransferase CheR
VEHFREVVARRLGLNLDDSKLDQLAEILSRRLEATRQPATVYFGRFQAPTAPRDEVRELARELTVPESYFFRNIEQFRAFSEIALPDRILAQSDCRRLRILSAGCASGEEAYSLAILVSGAPALAGWEVSIRGIDVSLSALERAAGARYSAWSLRETPADIRTRYFRADGRNFDLDPAIRGMVTFEEGNLAEDGGELLQSGSFDIVFCRNVLMYFRRETALALVARISRSLAPGGFLYLGHAETLRGLSQDFHLRHTHETFYYQRREASEGPHQVAAARERSIGVVALDPVAASTSDESWVETIRRASERINTLTAAPAVMPGQSATKTPSSGKSQARAWSLGLAVELLGQERYPEAHAELSSLPPEAARDPDVLLLKAVLLTHGGDLATAERVSMELLAVDELSAGAHYLMALCRESAGDRSGAAHHDKVATYLDPNFAMPRLHLGLLARRAGDPGRARRELEQALVLLQGEDASRLLLFGGGFNREALIALCRAEFLSCGGLA